MSKKNSSANSLTAIPPREAHASSAAELTNGRHRVQPAAQASEPRRITWKGALTALASLKLTVVLLAMSMVLVFAGTLAQVDQGIDKVVAKYFWSSFVWIPLQLVVPRDIHIPSSIGIPFLGGQVLGLLLLSNLLAAHSIRFKMSWKRIGIWMIHSGLILLLLGEALTRERAQEGRMPIEEGKTANFLEDPRHTELALIDLSDPVADKVVAIPSSRLRAGARLSNPSLPVDVEIVKFLENSSLPDKVPENATNPATKGAGLLHIATEIPEVSGTEDDKADAPSVYVKLIRRGNGESLGVWLVSELLKDQRIDIDGKPFEISLRPQRTYLPYSLHLKRFTHEVYPGTDKPKDFRSFVNLTEMESGTNREVEIYMNAPLRFEGKTFYQNGFMDPSKTGGVRGTILNVVDNPGWLIPYISCVLVALGMLVHFSIKLVFFALSVIGKPNAAPQAAAHFGIRFDKSGLISLLATLCLVGVFGAYLIKVAKTPDGAGANGFDLEKMRRIPVLAGGRIKPLDTLARTTLRVMSFSEEFEDKDGKKHPAIDWFVDAMFADVRGAAKQPGSRVGLVWESPVFKIENDQVLNLLGLAPRPGLRYCLSEFYDKFDTIFDEARKADDVDRHKRDKYQQKIIELSSRLSQFEHVIRSDVVFIPPTEPSGKWQSLRQLHISDASDSAKAVLYRKHHLDTVKFDDLSAEQKTAIIHEFEDEVDREIDRRNATDPLAKPWIEVRDAYRQRDAAKFNELLDSVSQAPATVDASALEMTPREVFFNHFEPFYQCAGIYVFACALTVVGLLTFAFRPDWFRYFRRPAFGLLGLGFAIHSYGLIERMLIQGRPPVTNLYSSAIFIGWGAVLTCLVLETFFSYGVANLVGGLIGFVTCVIAHNLSKDSGDTMEMMEAVLDTNLWLSTHVTMVTFGYVATFVAGFLGMMFIGLGMATPVLDRGFFKAMSHMIYGVVCFATMLSFTGTVLGGIWADQSWGRFWGWDPKENGAVLIVIWNAIVLHARWGGLVKQRGMAVLTVLGNIVTTWSWFGTNKLGVGLHSYGFSTSGLPAMIGFAALCLAVAGVGALIPTRIWTSFGSDRRRKSAMERTSQDENNSTT